MYGHHYSKSTVSAITMSAEEQVKAFHERRVESKYAVIYCDATYLRLRRDTVSAEALHVLLGITPDGRKEVLDYAVYPSEAASNYREMLAGLKARGLEQVLLFVSDRLAGMKDALQGIYLKAQYQSCWVHLSRNVFRIVRVKDRTDILQALKSVYTQRNKDDAQEMMTIFYNLFIKY